MQTAPIAAATNSLKTSTGIVRVLPCRTTKLKSGSLWVGTAIYQSPLGKMSTSSITSSNASQLLKQAGPTALSQEHYRFTQCSKACPVSAAAEKDSNQDHPNENLISSLVVVSFYKFADFPDHAEMRSPLRELCEELRVSGGIILAPEGINGSICGTRDSVQKVLEFIQADSRLKGLRQTESPAGPEDEIIHHGHSSKSPLGAGDDAPFRWDHVRVKLKKEVVTLGVPGISPAKKVGKYANPREFNALLSDPDTMVVDVRNSYETRIGRFKGAIDPHTSAFREFPSWVEKNLFMHQSNGVISGEQKPSIQENFMDEKEKINFEKGQYTRRVAMYCTGGIRCEKATSFLMSKGFEEVYHLEGGILKYLEEVPPSESLWEGECFVFDKRVSVEHGLKQGTYKLCYACKKPVNDDDVLSAEWEYGVSCPYCYNAKSEEEKARARARQRQFEMWGVVGGPDKGVPPSQRGKKQKSGPFHISRSL